MIQKLDHKNSLKYNLIINQSVYYQQYSQFKISIFTFQTSWREYISEEENTCSVLPFNRIKKYELILKNIPNNMRIIELKKNRESNEFTDYRPFY
jgi:hypothetical protein